MNFEWDEVKRQRNLEKHRIDFVEALEVFDHVFVEYLDARYDYGEERLQAFEWMKGRLIKVIYTERRDIIRIISARKATHHEEAKYYRQVRP
jgi:uncharacterized DUF497 family protein